MGRKACAIRSSREYRAATLSERRDFYENEFPVEGVLEWFDGRELPQLCAVDAGSETGIIVDKKFKDTLFYFPFNELEKKIRKYAPEDVYYDRNKYSDYGKVLRTLNFKDRVSQELVFDIDSDNIKCSHPEGHEACNACLSKAYKWALRMKKSLEKDFKRMEVVYSGRGFHVHVLDENAFFLNFRERAALNKKFSKYPIDPWVSRGYIRLIRMPYTLNGLVSRIVTPVDVEKGFNEKATNPKFLKS